MAEILLTDEQARAFYPELDEAEYAALCGRPGVVIAQIDWVCGSMRVSCEGHFVPHVFVDRLAAICRRSRWCDRMHMWS